MNLGEIQTEINTRIEEDPATPVYWSGPQVIKAVNDCYEEMSEWSGWYERRATITKVAGTYYDLWSTSVIAAPELVAWPLRVYNTNISRWLGPNHYRDLDRENFEWEKARGEPDQWFMRGSNFLGTFPRKSAGGGSMDVDFIGVPPALVNPTDTPGFPQEFHVGLVNGAMAALYAQDREWKKSQRYWGLYKTTREALKSFVGHRVAIDRRPIFGGE